MQVPPEGPIAGGGLSPSRLSGRIEFRNVAFKYPGAPERTLDGISFAVEPGQKVALLGRVGSGKSTLLRLLVGLYTPEEGVILLDGTDIRQFDPVALRSQIGMAIQEPVLLSGTVRENILYGRPGATPQEVEDAARAANVHEFVTALPGGYDTVVGERGVKLSGGQRQRVAIARAILKDPRILILDEATSALDNESEALVQLALERLMQGRTTFVIAHRLSTIRNADRIVVLDAGRIMEDGPHAQLIAAGGLYRDLYELQFRAQQEGRTELA